MKLSRRARRMQRHHTRAKNSVGFNLVSLMDIFTILVFFLLVNSSSEQVLPNLKILQLPESVAEQKPRQVLRVMVTQTEILLQDRNIITLEQVKRSGKQAIPELVVALQNQKKRRVLKEDSEKEGREIMIMADKDIPYNVLKKVMRSCSQAGFSKISLPVLQKARG
ncbi:MAG: biopolymer transporter ExbD [Gammaproteobacteria bacterium]|nr:biopolymer transporter ExbD [Gammaproteobacteria bacterium]